MRVRIKIVLCLIVFALWALTGCGRSGFESVEIKAYPVVSATEVVTRTGVEFDESVTSDGNGSLRLTAAAPATFRLYETGDIDAENCRLIYRAKVRTRDVHGEVYIEMWCQFSGKGEFFSRALHAPLSGTADWATQETPFFLRKGENPENVKLNIVVNGAGTAWIDDVRLVRGPL